MFLLLDYGGSSLERNSQRKPKAPSDCAILMWCVLEGPQHQENKTNLQCLKSWQTVFKVFSFVTVFVSSRLLDLQDYCQCLEGQSLRTHSSCVSVDADARLLSGNHWTKQLFDCFACLNSLLKSPSHSWTFPNCSKATK